MLTLQALGPALLPERYTAFAVLAAGLLRSLPGPACAGPGGQIGAQQAGVARGALRVGHALQRLTLIEHLGGGYAQLRRLMSLDPAA